MPSLKEVKSRIVSITSTQQITKAMKMVSAAKLRRAQDNIIQMRPYAQKLSEIMKNISGASSDTAQNPYAQERPINRVLIIAITSDRGLCGAFNSNVAKMINNILAEDYSAQYRRGDVEIMTLGRKGYEFFSRRGYRLLDAHTHVFGSLSFASVRGAAEEAMQGFLEGRFDRVEIVYNEFKNVATQVLRREQLLPVQEVKDNAAQAKNTQDDYIFEPSKQEIFAELIPKTLKVQLYKAVLESNASEHGARMTTMDKATENAGELLKELKLVYNRTRQASITKEILEIVGGAEALASQ